MSFIYLASPYTHPDPFVREHRYISTMQAMQQLLLQRKWVYAPIVHCHELAKVADLPKDHEFWRDYGRAMLGACRELRVLRLEGWQESRGVAEEIAYATTLGKEVSYL